MILGKDLILSTPSVGVIAAAKSCQIKLNTDFIEVCAPTDGAWKQYKPAINSWEVSCEMLITTAGGLNSLRSLVANHTIFQIRFYDSGTNILWGGATYIKSFDVTGRVGSLATLSVSFQPSGKLYTSEWETVNLGSMASRFVISTITSSAITMVNVDSTTNIIAKGITMQEGGTLKLINQVVAISDSFSNVQTLLLSSATAQDVNDYLNARIAIIAAGGSTKQSVLPAGDYTLLSLGNSIVQVKQI